MKRSVREQAIEAIRVAEARVESLRRVLSTIDAAASWTKRRPDTLSDIALVSRFLLDHAGLEFAPSTVRDACGIKPESCHVALSRLAARGDAKRNGYGRWTWRANPAQRGDEQGKRSKR